MSLRRISETALYVVDLERSRAFYEGVLGLELYGMAPGRHVFFRMPDGGMLLCFLAEAARKGEGLPAHGAEGGQHAAFEAGKPDYEPWKARLKAAGCAVEFEKIWDNGVRSFYFRDPDGHLLEICEPGLWSKAR